MTEVPEMFGAEKMLMARAESREVYEDIVSLINNFKQYFLSYGEPVYENPSPGNKAGGISTLEDKSLGCTQKAGTSPVVDVLQYGVKLRKKGSVSCRHRATTRRPHLRWPHRTASWYCSQQAEEPRSEALCLRLRWQPTMSFSPKRPLDGFQRRSAAGGSDGRCA